MSSAESEVIETPKRVPLRRGLRHLWKRFLASPIASEEFILVFTSIVVGIGTGIGAVLFRYLIRGVEWIGYEWLPSVTASLGKAYVVIVPAVGGLIVGLLIFHFAREAKGHGVPEVMEAVALKGGRIRPVVAIIKSLASSLSIGSGGSVGREGPIVQIGSALGSSVGQIFQLSDERIRNLVACGAAGGIAATFNAPIAGVVFAIEVILGELSVAYFSTVVISAVTSSVIGQAIFGDVAAFPLVTQYHINSIWEYCLSPPWDSGGVDRSGICKTTLFHGGCFRTLDGRPRMVSTRCRGCAHRAAGAHLPADYSGAMGWAAADLQRWLRSDREDPSKSNSSRSGRRSAGS